MKAELPAAARRKRGFWRTCRVYFRRVRIAVWLLILVLLGALLYLTQIGLPDFAKKPLLENLRARGLDLQFSRLRLSWYRGIVAENVRFGRADEPLSPELTVAQVQLRLNHHALARLQFQIDSLVLRQGRLVWPLAETNQAPRQLAVENIQTELRFLPGDEWALDQFTAGFAGARIQLSGTVAHASAVREWKLLKAEQAAPVSAWRDRLREFADTLERIHFSAPPTLRLDVRGDARDLASFGIRVLLDTPGADTPWGAVNQGRFSARLFPATTNGAVQRRAEPGSRRGANTLGHHRELAAHRPPGLVREPDEPGQWRPDSARRARRDRMGQGDQPAAHRSRRRDGGPDEPRSTPTWRSGRDTSRPSGAAPPTPSSMPNGSTP